MSRYISHSLLKRTYLISTRPLIQYRHFNTSSPRMDEDNPQTVRPPHKRVRGADEHVDAGNTAQALSEAKGMNFKEGEIPEWLSKPPFSYGQSWEGWERKWRCSCWCGQSKCSKLSSSVCLANTQPLSHSLVIPLLSRHVTVMTVSDYMVGQISCMV
jgi:hypothetical protein